MAADARAELEALGFEIVVYEDGGVFTAWARRVTNGDPFGPRFTADSEGEAHRRLAAWVEWQRDHSAALATLQSAEGVYHRLAVQTFAGEAAGHRDGIQAALAVMDEARQALDAVRGRQPWRS
jgi:hypothetical protein